MDSPQESPAEPATGPAPASASRSWLGRVLRAAGWSLVVLYFLFAGTLLVLRYAVLPCIADFRADIEAAASRAVGLPVPIGRIEAGWDGLNPDLLLTDVVLSDRQGRPALALSRVEAILSWQSVVRLADPGALRHRRSGSQRAAGCGRAHHGCWDSDGGESDPAILEWVLDQPHIRVRDALVVWEDAQRKAPPRARRPAVRPRQLGRSASLRFTAVPPARLAARIDLRANSRGHWRSIGGSPQAKSTPSFNTRTWRAGVLGSTIPVHLPQGRGAVRLWGDWDEGGAKITADLALEDLRIRLGERVPELDLVTMRGRLRGKYGRSAWEAEGQQVEIRPPSTACAAPTDFRVEWRQEPGKGRFSAKPAPAGWIWGYWNTWRDIFRSTRRAASLLYSSPGRRRERIAQIGRWRRCLRRLP